MLHFLTTHTPLRPLAYIPTFLLGSFSTISGLESSPTRFPSPTCRRAAETPTSSPLTGSVFSEPQVEHRTNYLLSVTLLPFPSSQTPVCGLRPSDPDGRRTSNPSTCFEPFPYPSHTKTLRTQPPVRVGPPDLRRWPPSLSSQSTTPGEGRVAKDLTPYLWVLRGHRPRVGTCKGRFCLFFL